MEKIIYGIDPISQFLVKTVYGAIIKIEDISFSADSPKLITDIDTLEDIVSKSQNGEIGFLIPFNTTQEKPTLKSFIKKYKLDDRQTTSYHLLKHISDMEKIKNLSS